MHTGNSARNGNDKESGNSQQRDMLSFHVPTLVNQRSSSKKGGKKMRKGKMPGKLAPRHSAEDKKESALGFKAQTFSFIRVIGDHT